MALTLEFFYHMDKQNAYLIHHHFLAKNIWFNLPNYFIDFTKHVLCEGNKTVQRNELGQFSLSIHNIFLQAPNTVKKTILLNQL